MIFAERDFAIIADDARGDADSDFIGWNILQNNGVSSEETAVADLNLAYHPYASPNDDVATQSRTAFESRCPDRVIAEKNTAFTYHGITTDHCSERMNKVDPMVEPNVVTEFNRIENGLKQTQESIAEWDMIFPTKGTKSKGKEEKIGIAGKERPKNTSHITRSALVAQYQYQIHFHIIPKGFSDSLRFHSVLIL
jgi:hypothetical protein